MTKFRQATASEYAAWLQHHLDNGGHITHAYDYPMPSHYLLALADFTLDGECGSRACHILVPDGIGYRLGDHGLGHNVLHLADGTLIGGIAACFSDDVLRGFPGYEELLAADLASQRGREAAHRAEGARLAETDLGRYRAGSGTP